MLLEGPDVSRRELARAARVAPRALAVLTWLLQLGKAKDKPGSVGQREMNPHRLLLKCASSFYSPRSQWLNRSIRSDSLSTRALTAKCWAEL